MTEGERWMSRALELAERGRGWVEPNPLVGAVAVRDGVVVGEGWHEKFGGPHAEVNALAAAGEAARGATLFVTLEPCCHHGKTGPCTDAILRAGVQRVVAAMTDPFPEVAGSGIERLRAAGVDVEVGCGEADAHSLNAPYLKLIHDGRPYVHAKWAMTLDGKIATRTGRSKWISCEQSREFVHRLRGRMDAIIVGAGTVIADDPLLTARPPGPRVPSRVILTGRRRLPGGNRLQATLDQAPLAIVVPRGLRPAADYAGGEVIELPARDDRPSVEALLGELGRRRMTNVLVEGGSEIFGAFLEARLIDELHVFIAPRVVGGRAAPSPVAGTGLESIADPRRPIVRWSHAISGNDLYVNALFMDEEADSPPQSNEPA